MPRRTILLLAILPLCAQAQVFKWVDEKGKVHYGDRPVAKEIKNVPVLREAKQQTSVPQPGMKAEEVRKLYGEPERVQKTSTKNGVTLVWTYRRSKLSSQDFVVKIEAGEVVEVLTDTGASSPPVAAAPQVPAGNVSDQDRFSSVSESDRAAALEETARREAAERDRRCAALRESMQNIENQERRGGSAATMDRLREKKRKDGDKAWSQGC